MHAWQIHDDEEASRTTGRTCRACGHLLPLGPWDLSDCPRCAGVPDIGPRRSVDLRLASERLANIVAAVATAACLVAIGLVVYLLGW